MKRRLFNILTAFSLLLCVAMVLLWARSYRRGDAFRLRLPQLGDRFSDDTICIYTGRGGISFEFDRWAYIESEIRQPASLLHDHPSIWFPVDLYPEYPEELSCHWRWGGFAADVYHHDLDPLVEGGDYITYSLALITPCYVWVILLAMLPLLQCRQRYARPRTNRAGLCLQCGYDLRASKERCPECGTVIATGAKA